MNGIYRIEKKLIFIFQLSASYTSSCISDIIANIV
jgi:hypothetical protein